MKKILAFLLALTLLVSLAACASNHQNASTGGDDAQQSGNTDVSTSNEDSEQTPEDEQQNDQDATGEPEQGSEDENALDPATASLSDIMTLILTDVSDLPGVGEIEVTDELFTSYLFIEPIEGAEALASEAMINAIAHSVVLLRLPEEADAASVATEIEEKADPRKWICVEAEKVQVVQQGNLILLCMTHETTCDEIVANFNALFE